ncbi:MAG: hypothetical protein COB08_011005 [Rhodobacteraceae bacterium]|nr:hypothetical protein [Paracoccaceae bacterium]
MLKPFAVLLLLASPALAQTNAAINCYQGGLVPIESEHLATILFSNNSEYEVDILWLNYDGEEIYYNSLKPGESYEQTSYFSHPWVVYRAESNVCKGIIVPFTDRVEFSVN